MNARAELKKVSKSARIVIKIGSGVLADREGRIDSKIIRRLADEIAPLAGVRRWPVIVSSGAIATGMAILELKGRPKNMAGLQAAAAVGQSRLVELWSSAFRKYQIPVAQVLLTHADLANRQRFLNARRALGEIQRRGAIAVINENDTVSFEEIAFGDNDELAAQVANLVDARVLMMLSVTKGVMDDGGERISIADVNDPILQRVAKEGTSALGSGGMVSKLRAARTAASRGTYVGILEGKHPGNIQGFLDGDDVGTLLYPDKPENHLRSRAHWIAHTLRPVGTLFVDAGAMEAVQNRGKSLLPSGVRKVSGDFRGGDPVDIAMDDHGKVTVFARGLTRYSTAEIEGILGHPSREIGELLGFKAGDAVVHRDDLVLLGPESDERPPQD